MGTINYGCGMRVIEGKRVFNILLLGFQTIKDVVFMNPYCCYKFSSLSEYPEYANHFNINKGNYKIEPVSAHINFSRRFSKGENRLFNSLKSCAEFCKILQMEEKDYLRMEAMKIVVTLKDIDEKYWEKCVEVLVEHPTAMFTIYYGTPCYVIEGKNVLYSVENDSVILE